MIAEQGDDKVKQKVRVQKGEIDKDVAHHIRGEVAHQLEKLNLTRKITGEITGLQENLRLHHKILYGILVFFGLVLIWYGAWYLVGITPVLKVPFIALIVGVLLLVSTRTLYRKLAG